MRDAWSTAKVRSAAKMTKSARSNVFLKRIDSSILRLSILRDPGLYRSILPAALCIAAVLRFPLGPNSQPAFATFLSEVIFIVATLSYCGITLRSTFLVALTIFVACVPGLLGFQLSIVLAFTVLWAGIHDRPRPETWAVAENVFYVVMVFIGSRLMLRSPAISGLIEGLLNGSQFNGAPEILLIGIFSLARRMRRQMRSPLRDRITYLIFVIALIVLAFSTPWPGLRILAAVFISTVFLTRREVDRFVKPILRGTASPRLIVSIVLILCGLGVTILKSKNWFMDAKLHDGRKLLILAERSSEFERRQSDLVEGRRASFASWISLAKAEGIAVDVADSLPGDLSEYDGLALVNHSIEFSEAETRMVREFVIRGGGLLILADHTDLFGQVAKTNEILEGWGVWLNDDSAVSYTKDHSWPVGALQFTSGITSSLNWLSSAMHVSIGATVGTGAKGYVFLYGMNGFADKPINDPSRSRLGNLQLDSDERKGALPLAAYCRPGLGRVFLFGDTSLFQDAALPTTWAIVSEMTLQSVDRGRLGFSSSLDIVIVAVLFLLFLMVPAIEGLAVLLILMSIVAPSVSALEFKMMQVLGSEAVVIDLHCRKGVDLKFSEYQGIIAVSDAVSAFGKFPVVLHSGVSLAEAAHHGATMLFCGRETYLREVEVKQILSLVESGSNLIIEADPTTMANLSMLLQSLGIRIHDKPIGRCEARWSRSDTVIILPTAFEISASSSTDLLKSSDTVVGCLVRHGEGRVLLVASEGFFLDSGDRSREQTRSIYGFLEGLADEP